MASILDEGLVLESPEEAFTYDVLEFSKTYDIETFKRIYGYVSQNFERIHGKMCWKKYHYIAVTKLPFVERWLTDKHHYESASPRLIIASELLDNKNKSRWEIQCRVFKSIGKFGKIDRRSQWYNDTRNGENPIISSGWKFRDYDIFMVPDSTIEMLYTFLPHQTKEN